MKLQKYGITLDRLTEADIEMVRRYRNSAEVKNFMQFRKRITRRMQKKWLKSIENYSNYYFIIIYEGKKIGLINIKNIDWVSNISESGLFLWDRNYVDSPAPLLASIVLSEFGYGFLYGVESEVKILQSNKKAIDFNKSLGYTEKYVSTDGFAIYRQTKESFLASTSSLRKKALTLCKNDPNLYLYLEPHDWRTELAQKCYEYLGMKPQNYKMLKEGDTEVYSFLFDFS